MVRIVLCALCLVALAVPAGAQYQPAPNPAFMDPFRPRQQQPSYYDNYMRNLNQELQRTLQQQQRDREHSDSSYGNNPVRRNACLSGAFRTCAGLPQLR